MEMESSDGQDFLGIASGRGHPVTALDHPNPVLLARHLCPLQTQVALQLQFARYFTALLISVGTLELHSIGMVALGIIHGLALVVAMCEL